MTIANQTNRTSATGNAAVGQVVAFSFPITDTSDLKVYQRVTATGVETLLTETTNYTVAITGDTGGTVTTVTAVAATAQIHIYRDTPSTQELDLTAGGTFNAENLEDAIDKNTKLSIENQDALNRTLRFPQTDPTSSIADMPSSINRASKWLYFGTDGVPTAAASVTPSTATVSAFGETLIDDAAAVNARTTLEVNDRPTGIFNVKDPAYGAVGDGTVGGAGTDDTAAIQAALDAAEAASGGVVYMPPGSYRITSTLTITEDSIHLIGAGSNTIIYVDADVVGISLTNTPAWFRLANFRMMPTDASTTNPAIQVAVSSAQWLIENVFIVHSGSGVTKKMFDTGIYVESAVAGTIRNCMAVRVATTGFKLGNGVNALSAMHFDRCYSDTDTGATTRGFLAKSVHTSTFSACVAEGYSAKGMEMVTCTDNALTAMHFECDSENGQTCLELNASSEHNVITGGRFLVKDATGLPIVLDTATNNTLINPHCTIATTFITISGASQWNHIIGGDIATTEIAFGTTSNNFLLPEEGVFLWDTEAVDTKWRIGDNNTGLETQLGDTAALLAARTAGGVSLTAAGGTDPFDLAGNLLIKSKTIANAGIYFYTGSTATKHVQIATDGGVFMFTLKSGADQAAAGAAADELYHDTDDNTIKIGV